MSVQGPSDMKLQLVVLCILASYSKGVNCEVCRTPGCAEIAGIFKKSMDPKVSPCENFYLFTCSNFIKNTVIPQAEAQYGVSEVIDKLIRQELKSELESKTLRNQPTSFQKAKDFYYSCMDTALIEKFSLMNMKTRLKHYGGWPVLEDNWKETNFNWIETMKKLKDAGQYNDQIMSIYVDISENDTSKRIIVVDSGYHTLSGRRLRAGLQDILIQTYLDVLVDIAVAFGATRQNAERDMKEVLQFETALVNLTYSSEGVPNVPKTISELQEVWPYIPWLELIRTYIGYDLNITDDEPIAVQASTYLTNLANLLNSTSKRLLANYIMTQLVFTSREDLNQEILNISQRLNQVRFGKTNLPSRWEFCLGKLFGNMDVALASTYIRKYFSPKKKQKAEQITKLFQIEFARIIAEEDWITNNTKNRALNKVRSIKNNVGYPNELLNDIILNNYFKRLHICRSDLYDNVLALWKWSSYRSHQKLRQPVNPSSWEEQAILDVVIANARYSVDRNSIDIFAAILQNVYFSSDRPPFLNYGTLSSVVGHELTHSVDNNSRNYDERGDHKNWWDVVSAAEFEKRAKALANEYSTYVVSEFNMTLNGEAILGEAIADLGGYKIARNALETWLKTKDQVSHLVGLEQYTSTQIFWLGAATAWCAKERLEFLRTEVIYGDHPPAEFRVNGPFRQSYQFAQDWGCPLGSYMNPENKYNVW